MCLKIKSGTRLHIAKKDIEVYKLIGKNDVSVYRGFHYKPNTKYHLRFPLKPILARLDNGRRRTVERGYHSYIDHECLGRCLGRGSRYKVVKFIIPKGAEYYVGADNDMVSTAIISGDLKAIRRNKTTAPSLRTTLCV